MEKIRNTTSLFFTLFLIKNTACNAMPSFISDSIRNTTVDIDDIVLVMYLIIFNCWQFLTMDYNYTQYFL